MDINQIREYLPHRYPFLLVDRVAGLDLEKNVFVPTRMSASTSRSSTGISSEHPIMPGVLIIEAMAQAAGILGFKMMDLKPADGTCITLSARQTTLFVSQWCRVIN